MVIIADTMEPFELRARLREKGVEVVDVRLVGTGYLDYLITAWDGHLIAIERKEVHDLSHRVDDAEQQLRKAVETVGESGEVILIREGIMLPATKTSTVLCKQNRKSGVIYHHRMVNIPYAYFESFLYRLDKLGISTFSTGNMEATVDLLVQIEKHSQDPDFANYRQYIRRKVPAKYGDETTATLVNLGVGIAKAEKLTERYGTVWNVLHATKKDLLTVEGIGERTVDTLFAKVGRRTRKEKK